MSIAALSDPISERSRCQPQVDAFFERRTCSVQYVVSDPATPCCAVIDPVLDYDEKSGSIATWSADALLAFIVDHDLTVEWILDTHPHADHFSAAGYLKDRTGAQTVIGERVVEVQRLWKEIYHLPDTFAQSVADLALTPFWELPAPQEPVADRRDSGKQ
jgi:glyoxylase-like metal-dependent hydrolase (beta-lactamase superfamily II)